DGASYESSNHARVSTDDKGQDPENQLTQLREWCASTGHTIVNEYTDFETGRKAERKQFDARLATRPQAGARGDETEVSIRGHRERDCPQNQRSPRTQLRVAPFSRAFRNVRTAPQLPDIRLHAPCSAGRHESPYAWRTLARCHFWLTREHS